MSGLSRWIWKYSSSLRFSGRGSSEEASIVNRPVGVEHLDRAKMPGGRGAVEQDQMPDLLADVADLRQRQTAGDRAQRQVVELDIAADVGIDAGREVFQHLARQLFLAAAHVEHDAGADGGKADHGRHGRGDQQFCRQPPVPPFRNVLAPPKNHRPLPMPLDAPGLVAAALNGDSGCGNALTVR